MKLIIFGNCNSSHIKNWSLLLSGKCSITLISLSRPSQSDVDYFESNSINVIYPKFLPDLLSSDIEGGWRKLFVLISIPWLLHKFMKLKPTVIHAHYASSYGFILAVIPFFSEKKILSVWGSDLYNFPYKSFLHKLAFKFTLSKYRIVQVTSYFMVEELVKWISESRIKVVPFPIDINRFTSMNRPMRKKVVIGTVKTLHPKYGIDKIINVVYELKNIGYDVNCSIYGGGPQEQELKTLVAKLALNDVVTFHGFIPFENVHQAYKNLDIYIALSTDKSETFGVAILEAGASGLPVIVANIGGLPEVVLDGSTGFVVKTDNINETVNIIERLLSDAELRRTIGENAVKHVSKNYSNSRCKMLQFKSYDEIVK